MGGIRRGCRTAWSLGGLRELRFAEAGIFLHEGEKRLIDEALGILDELIVGWIFEPRGVRDELVQVLNSPVDRQREACPPTNVDLDDVGVDVVYHDLFRPHDAHLIRDGADELPLILEVHCPSISGFACGTKLPYNYI